MLFDLLFIPIWFQRRRGKPRRYGKVRLRDENIILYTIIRVRRSVGREHTTELCRTIKRPNDKLCNDRE
jgi:hypothetical protein